MARALSMLGGALGSILATNAANSFIQGGISSYYNSKSAEQAYEYSRLLQQQQYDLQQRGLREGYSNARYGLEAAGYNPIIAATNASGFSMTPSSTQSPMQTSLGNSADINQFQQNQLLGTQNQLLGAQTNATNAGASLAQEQAKTEQAKRVQMDFQNAMTDVETHLKQKDLSTYDRRFYASIYEQMQRAEMYRQEASVVQYNAETGRIGANAQQQNATTQRLNYQLDKYNQDIVRDVQKRYKDFGKKHPYLRNVDETLQRYFNGFNLGIGKKK